MISESVRSQIEDAVREAGLLSKRWFGKVDRVSYKSETEMVTVADCSVERVLKERLHEVLPEAGMLGEEGTDTCGENGTRFVVDPIDGTSNFVRGLPFYAVSLALKEGQQTVFASVYNPALDLMYVASAGGGARCNGSPVHVSCVDKMIKVLAGTGFSCIRNKTAKNNMPILNDAIYRLQSIRRLGSAALNLCLVAEGKLDLFWEIGIKPWDVEGGMLVVQEAGGKVTDMKGESHSDCCKDILASNGLVHDQFLEILSRTYW